MKTWLGPLKILVIFFGIPIAVFMGAYLWDEGYLGSYWERYGSLYDPKLKVHRCLNEYGQLAEDLEPPCVMMTLRGRKAMERHKIAYVDSGGNPEVCAAQALQWLLSKEHQLK